jgi:hypothetical protein
MAFKKVLEACLKYFSIASRKNSVLFYLKKLKISLQEHQI